MNAYHLSKEADRDIENIAEYTLEKWGVTQVNKYVGGLIDCFKDIANNDHFGQDASEFAPGLYRFGYESHIIFFVRQEENVLIVRVLHSQMDFRRHLDE